MSEYDSSITFSEGIIPEVPGTTPTPVKKTYQISVYDSVMARTGIVDDFEYFEWIRNWYTPDTWEIRINRNKANSALFLASRSLAADGSWNYGGFISIDLPPGQHIGMIEDIQLSLTKEGKKTEQYVITGRGVRGVLATRIARYGTDAGTGYDVQTAAIAETAMRHYVDKNCIDATANRPITGLTLYPSDLLRGGTIDHEARFEDIDTVLESIGLKSGLSYGVLWTESGLNFVFVVNEGVDRSASVTLSTGFGNVEEYNYLDSILKKKNLVYMGGTGTGASRVVQEAYAGVAEPSGWNRREAFVDASDCATTDELTSRGTEILEELAESTSLEVQYQEGGSFVLGTDFDLGDTISVVYPGIVSIVSRMITMTEIISPEYGLKRTLGVGKTYPDLKSVVKDIKKATSAEVRK